MIKQTRDLVIASLFLVIGVMIAVWFLPRRSEVFVYDCSIAEISPDIQPEVRNQCRKIRAASFQRYSH
jgi:hypothetical protein